MEKGHILYYPEGLHNIDLKSVELEEYVTEDNTVLKYKSSNGSNKYIATSDSADGGGGIIIEFKNNSPFPRFDWVVANNISNTAIVEVDDIRVKDGADVSNIHMFQAGFNNYNNYSGQFWTRNGEKIEGTTGDTLISDPKIFDLIKADVIKTKYIHGSTGTGLANFEVHIMSVNACTTINGYKYAGFPSADIMQYLYASN